MITGNKELLPKLSCYYNYETRISPLTLLFQMAWQKKGHVVIKTKRFVLLGARRCSANFMAVLLLENTILCVQVGQL